MTIRELIEILSKAKDQDKRVLLAVETASDFDATPTELREIRCIKNEPERLIISHLKIR